MTKHVQPPLGSTRACTRRSRATIESSLTMLQRAARRAVVEDPRQREVDAHSYGARARALAPWSSRPAPATQPARSERPVGGEAHAHLEAARAWRAQREGVGAEAVSRPGAVASACAPAPRTGASAASATLRAGRAARARSDGPPRRPSSPGAHRAGPRRRPRFRVATRGRPRGVSVARVEQAA